MLLEFMIRRLRRLTFLWQNLGSRLAAAAIRLGTQRMKTGTVKWFNARKGYGFLKPVDGGFDVYVDIAAVKRAGLAELREGQTINFDTAVDERTGEIFAENLSVPPSSPGATPSLPGPLARRKLSWLGRPSHET
jgi:CspA family cold shock protein